ncbi:MAG: DUF3187 family protein [Planctomycetota bacterium]|jgi:hypothetical protein|nr:DUF3187 family protein [Planctomycetota bacterium]
MIATLHPFRRQALSGATVRSAASLLLGLSVLSASGCSLLPERLEEDPRPIVRGPEPTRLQRPLALNFLAFRPRRANTQPKGTTNLSWNSMYSSLYLDEHDSAGNKANLDGELWTNTLLARHGVGDDSDIEVEVGVLRAGSGFLDRYVNDFHRMFGFPDGGRPDADDDHYAMEIESKGDNIYELSNHRFGVLDTSVVWTQKLQGEDVTRPAIALRFGVELPTGDEDRGFSNGSVDYGMGLLAERSVGRWTWTGATDYVVTERSDAFRDAGVDMDNLWDVQGGVEYRWNDSGSLLAQLIYTTALARDIPLDALDEPILDLGVGIVWDHSDRSRVMLTFHEDLIGRGPDFGFAINWEWRFD